MAITIIDQPNSWSPRGQKLMLIASSTNTANIGFRYGLTVNNLATGESFTFYISPSVDGNMYFDVQPLLKMQNKESEYVHALTMDASLDDDKAFNEISFSISEYWLVLGVLTLNEGSNVNGTNFGVVNGYYQVVDGYKPNANTSIKPLIKYALDSTSALMMSDRTPATHYKNLGGGLDADNVFIPVHETDWGLMYISGNATWLTSNDTVQYRIILYDADFDTHVGSYQTIHGYDVEGLPIYPANINATIYDVRPELYPGWKFYKVNIKGSGGAQRSKDYIFYNMCEYNMCDCNFDNVRLAWVNSRSGYEYFNFTKRSEFTDEIERKSYRKVLFNNSTSVFNSYDRGLKQRQNLAQRVLTVTSDYIQKGEFELLRGLMVSNQVHWIQTDGSFIPVNIDENSFVEKNTADGKLYNVTLKVRMANEYWT